MYAVGTHGPSRSTVLLMDITRSSAVPSSSAAQENQSRSKGFTCGSRPALPRSAPCTAALSALHCRAQRPALPRSAPCTAALSALHCRAQHPALRCSALPRSAPCTAVLGAAPKPKLVIIHPPFPIIHLRFPPWLLSILHFTFQLPVILPLPHIGGRGDPICASVGPSFDVSPFNIHLADPTRRIFPQDLSLSLSRKKKKKHQCDAHMKHAPYERVALQCVQSLLHRARLTYDTDTGITTIVWAEKGWPRQKKSFYLRSSVSPPLATSIVFSYHCLATSFRSIV